MACAGEFFPDEMTKEMLEALGRSFQRSRMLLSAVDLDLFRAVGTEGRTAVQIAEALHIDPRATDRLMNGLVVLGILEKEGGHFRNTPVAARYLDSSSPDFMVMLRHLSAMWDRWGTLTQAVRAGRSVVHKPIEQRDPKNTEAFIDAMHYRGKADAKDVAANIGCENVSHVLDVGGGSGVYSMEIVRGRSDAKATVLDLSRVTEMTRKYAALEGLSDQMHTIEGDYLETDFRHGYDLMLMSAILHINSPDQNRLLLRKAFEALVPGGRVVVMEFLLEEDRIHPPHGAIFALNMLTGTECGDAYTEAEIRHWMEGAGLTNIERKESIGRASMLIGHKN
ncbi:methyltransferase domain-containing protein [bacterium]|nr:methyltransferase domain-containing protein [bacterium]